MKKLLSVFLAAVMIFSFASVAFAAGSAAEEAANVGAREYCTSCGNECTGVFGCTCCEACPGHLNENGEATNLTGYLECRFGYYLDADIMDGNGNVIYDGDNTVHYYWKVKCCDDCTGKTGCKCDCKLENGKTNKCPYCVNTDDDNIDNKVDQGIQSAQNGFINGIQTALKSVRDVMYKLFDALFEFLRLEDLLGKKPPITE